MFDVQTWWEVGLMVFAIDRLDVDNKTICILYSINISILNVYGCFIIYIYLYIHMMIYLGNLWDSC